MRGETRKLLVIDDNPAVLSAISAALGAEFFILQASNGEEGMAFARVERPDVILLDVVMPKVSGLEMLHELQRHAETRDIPVVVVTATKFDELGQSVIEDEPNVKGFLKKPCRIAEIRRQIELALQGPRQGRAPQEPEGPQK